MKLKTLTLNRGTVLAALTAIIALLLGLAVAPAAHAASGTLRGDMFIQQGDDQLHEVTVAAGSQQNLLITYSCNGGTCLNGQIVVSLDPGATPKPAAKGPEVKGEVVAGSTITFSIPTLPQGSAGQISLPVVMPAWTIPNGTPLDHSVTISSLGGQQTTTENLRTIIGAGIEHHSSIQMTAGGAYDGSTVYEVKACLDAKLPADVYGGLEIEAGSVLAASLPAGATIVNSGGGTVSGSTIEWVLPAIQSYGCLTKLVTVRYNADDPANVIGGDKQVDVAWNGAVYGHPAGSLGGSDVEHKLAGGQGNQDFVMVLTTPRHEGIPEAHATFGDPVSAVFNAINTGNADWDSATVRSPFSAALKPTGLSVGAMGGSGELWIKKNGGSLEKALSFDENRNISFGSLPGDWLISFDPNTDILNEVEVRLTGVVPGAAGSPLAWAGTVRNQLAGTNVNIAIDDVFNAQGRLVRTAAGETLDPAGSATEDWAVDGGAISKAALRTETCGTDGLTDINDRDADLCFWYYNVSNMKKAKDPVAYFAAPPGVTLSDISVHKNDGNQMPDPTLTVRESYPGANWTFVRLTWPAGTEMANTDAWRIDFHAKVKHAFYERHAIVGNLSLKADPFDCAIGNYWGSSENDSGASGVDLNDNGRLNDWGCVWGHNLDPIQAIGGRVVQSVQGFWDDEFAAGPAVSYSRPGREDQLRSTLENTATTFLRNAVMVTKLPRPGDKYILDSSSERNQATATFPVHLLERPVTPTLNSPVTTYWTDTVNACFGDALGASADPSGCTPAVWTNWDTTAPADLTAVTALKFDFGQNSLTPYSKWDVDVKVTTPTTGATEPDYAVIQQGSDPAEIALATSAARFRSQNDVLQQPVEALAVTINMPDALGPDFGTPTAVPLTSTGDFGVEQTVTAKLPKAGEAVIYIGGSEVNGVMTGGEETQEHTTDQGTYTLDKDTGLFTFTPADGFVGEAAPITYQIKDTRDRRTFSTYTPMVSPPAVPSPTSAVTSELVNVVQSTTVTVPSGSTIKLVNNNGTDLGSNSKVIDGKGTFTLDPATGVITFTPVAGYVGAVPAIKFAITDSFGQTGYAIYTPTVLAPGAPVITALTSTGVGTNVQTTQNSVVIPTGGRVRLVDVSGGVISSDTVTVSGKGTYSLNRDTGVISFQPAAGFSGVAPAVRWKVWDGFDQGSNVTTYTPTVTLPAAPVAAAKNSEAQANRTQSVTVTPPSGGTVRLLDGSSNVIDSNTLTVSGVGTYTIVPGTGVITFVPVPDYVGTPTPLSYRISDAYAQTSDSTYQVDVYTAPADFTSTGVGTATHTVTATIPASGHVRLIDGDGNVVDDDTIVAAEGTYRLNRGTGEISFEPALGFSGVAPGISYQTTDAQARVATATYVPTVTAPAAPVALPKTSVGEKNQPQSTSISVPANTNVRLVDGDNLVTRVTVPSQGTYEVNTATGELTFTPLPGFVGSPTPVNFQLTDAYGQSSRAAYQPRVNGTSAPGAQPDTAESRPGSSVTINPLSTDVAEEGHRLIATSVALKQKGKKAKTLRTPQGVWNVNAKSGAVRFAASSKFVGIATVPYLVRSSSGAWFGSTMSVVVKGSVRGKTSTTIYFGVRTAALTQTARKQIKSLVAKVPTIASSRVLSIGYVQPERYRGNDQTLSKRRATQLARAVSKSLNVSKVRITGKGRAKTSSAAARRATVTVNWTATQR